MQLVDVQSPGAPQGEPVAHPGEQPGAAHRPAVQILEPQSEAAPQGWPSLAVGAPAAGPHRPLWQFFDAQSVFASQSLPFPHEGAQAAAMHLSGVPPQTLDAQSESAVQLLPRLQLGEQPSGFGLAWHLPVLHLPDAQSLP